MLAVEHEDKLLSWRFDRLTDLGFEFGEALRIALGDLDLHEIADLVERGCPPDLALDILAPLA